MNEKVHIGKVVYKEGKYFLDVAGKMEAFPVGILADEGVLKELVGKEVEVFYSTPKPSVVVVKDKFRRVPILCNIPASWTRIGSIVTNPSREMTLTVANSLLKGGYITKEDYEKITADIG
jgi:hypothetical protein